MRVAGEAADYRTRRFEPNGLDKDVRIVTWKDTAYCSGGDTMTLLSSFSSVTMSKKSSTAMTN
jgi:hypothetical protein